MPVRLRVIDRNRARAICSTTLAKYPQSQAIADHYPQKMHATTANSKIEFTN
jgi:hypothetical protein